jgi:ferredoxin-NADP reductase
MARAAVLGRVTWRVAVVEALREETSTARTLTVRVPGWPGHRAGQHVDVRLTAPDGYTAVRSYSIASAPEGDLLDLTVELVADGEVSPYLCQEVAVGDRFEVRGPVGGWFVWRPEQPEPVQLLGGGSGIVPLMSMLRVRSDAGSRAPARLLYSVRSPQVVYYAEELRRRERSDAGLALTLAYTRSAPADWPRRPGRVDADLISASTWSADRHPTCYVCGPTGFVERVAGLLVEAGHDPGRIRTERFGPSGGT